MTTAILEGRGVGRVYGAGELAARVLHPSSIAVHPGEVVVLAGPSGSGKTTLLSILGLVLSPSEGEVWLHGRRVSHLPPDDLARLRRRSLGFVFQQFNLLGSLTATQNVELPLLLAKASRNERRTRALEALARVELAEHAHKKPRELSGGQQQRVAMARALVTDPAAILCDEPTASLDATAGRRFLDLLREAVAGTGRAALIVTHDERVMRIADRVVQVVDGRVAESAGPPGEEAA